MQGKFEDAYYLGYSVAVVSHLITGNDLTQDAPKLGSYKLPRSAKCITLRTLRNPCLKSRTYLASVPSFRPFK